MSVECLWSDVSWSPMSDDSWLPLTGCRLTAYDWRPATVTAYGWLSVDCLWPYVNVIWLHRTICQLNVCDRMSVNCLWQDVSWLPMTGGQLTVYDRISVGCRMSVGVLWAKLNCQLVESMLHFLSRVLIPMLRPSDILFLSKYFSFWIGIDVNDGFLCGNIQVFESNQKKKFQKRFLNIYFCLFVDFLQQPRGIDSRKLIAKLI